MRFNHRVRQRQVRRRTRVAASLATALFGLLLQQTILGQRADSALAFAPAAPARVRPIARREEQTYAIALAGGEAATVSVEQQGMDVAVQVQAPDGTLVADVNDEITGRGREDVDIVAAGSAVYRLTVTAQPGGADRTRQESRMLSARASALEKAGRFEEARPLFERALTLAADGGAGETAVALLQFRVAGNALETRDDRKAESLYLAVAATLERTVGAEAPYAAMAQSRLALIYQHAGEGPRAEALLRHAIEVIERTLGTDHLWYAQCLTTQASVRYDAGDLAAAEQLDRRAVAALERSGQTETVAYAALLNNLGEIARQRGDNPAAERLFRSGLDIAERLQGADTYRSSTTLGNLGILARDRKDYTTALDYDLRALAIRGRVLGTDHPDNAPLLNNLAVLYRSMGADEAALATHFRALELWEASVGPYHRGTLTSVGNIARLYAAMGDVGNAVVFQRRADAILEKQLALNVAAGSERQKLAFVRSVSERTDRTLSLHLRTAPDDRGAAALAALVLLQRKGRVLDAMIRQRAGGTADAAVLDRLSAANAELARVALADPRRDRVDDRRASIADLEARVEQLETVLSERSADVRMQIRPVTVEAVQAAIPADAALIEFALYRPFDPAAERNADAYGAPHYAAYVLRRDAAAAGVDLGEAAAIDRRVEALRAALSDPQRDVSPSARALHDAIVAPLLRAAGMATRLLVSPDGALNLVPFEALQDECGRFLIERYTVTYLSSGRDLLLMRGPRPAGSAPVIFADPLFGEPAAANRERPVTNTASATARRSVPPDNDLSTAFFTPLAATADEAAAIKALFPAAVVFEGARASKAALAQVNGPRILHIASHGFFLREPSPNPLLRSGVALAGANLTRADGILTALEASGLNLWGTRLVTLSACDTGVGEIRNGEGVYGLRRAFVLAGAETQVLSLWPVSDTVSRQTMVAYYSGLRDGLGRGEALRQAKLALLARRARRHPYYWASFIQSGEWGSLDGAR
jgi:CHAT domain-containing protein